MVLEQGGLHVEGLALCCGLLLHVSCLQHGSLGCLEVLVSLLCGWSRMNLRINVSIKEYFKALTLDCMLLVLLEINKPLLHVASLTFKCLK